MSTKVTPSKRSHSLNSSSICSTSLKKKSTVKKVPTAPAKKSGTSPATKSSQGRAMKPSQDQAMKTEDVPSNESDDITTATAISTVFDSVVTALGEKLKPLEDATRSVVSDLEDGLDEAARYAAEEEESAESSAALRLPNGVVIPYMRSPDDFYFKAAFESPSFSDPEHLRKRLLANLLFYQTNYFLLFSLGVLVLALLNPRDTLIGVAAVSSIGVTAHLAFSPHSMLWQNSGKARMTKRRRARSQRTDAARVVKEDREPLVMVLAAIACIYVFICTIHAMIMLVCMVLGPLLLVFWHATMRKRTYRSKLSHLLMVRGHRKTLMSRLLTATGIDIWA